jgi:hypothetical protein
MCASEDVRSEKKHLWEEMFTLASGIQANMNQVLDFSKRGKKKKIWRHRRSETNPRDPRGLFTLTSMVTSRTQIFTLF